MKRTIYILFFLFCSSGLFAQNKLDSAIISLKNGKLKEAQMHIDSAVIQEELKDSASTWYYSGNVYKALFLAYETNDNNSPYRNKAINDFQKSISLDKKKKFTESSRKNLKFLAKTIYNQAAQSFNTTSYPLAISNYKKYKKIMSAAYPETDFTEKDITHKLALANTYEKIAKEDPASSDMYTRKVIDLYKEVLELDSNNYNANLNLGIIYYNKGVEIVKNTDYSVSLEELSKVQDKMYTLFKSALPYVYKAHELKPKEEQPIVALQGIYVGLNDREMFNKYTKILEKVRSEKSIKEGDKN